MVASVRSKVLCGCAGRLLLGVTKTGMGLFDPARCPNRGWNPITYPISEEVPQTPIDEIRRRLHRKTGSDAHSLLASTPIVITPSIPDLRTEEITVFE